MEIGFFLKGVGDPDYLCVFVQSANQRKAQIGRAHV